MKVSWRARPSRIQFTCSSPLDLIHVPSSFRYLSSTICQSPTNWPKSASFSFNSGKGPSAPSPVIFHGILPGSNFAGCSSMHLITSRGSHKSAAVTCRLLSFQSASFCGVQSCIWTNGLNHLVLSFAQMVHKAGSGDSESLGNLQCSGTSWKVVVAIVECYQQCIGLLPSQIAQEGAGGDEKLVMYEFL